MSIARRRLGESAEERAAQFLERNGFHIVERNARTRQGEIDIVATDGATLVFVEVKAGRERARAGPERPALAVGPRKQRQLRRLAGEWLAAAPRVGGIAAIRFDVVGITVDAAGCVSEMEHLRNAF